jgi:rhodanese-related sulfurtransferase
MNTQTVAGMIAGARSRIQNLSVGEVASELQSGNVLLVDIREPEERTANGTIPGAVPAVRGMLEFYADPTSPYHRPEFETDRRIVLACASGGRSALAADALQQLGYNRVAHLDGGLKAWIAAGQPVETV